MTGRQILLVSVLLVSLVLGRAFGNPPPAVSVLAHKLADACRAQNLDAVKACYDMDGASPEEIDLALSPWQEYFNQSSDLTHWKFDKVTYQSLSDLARDKTVNPNFYASLTLSGAHRMGKHFYEPNLKAIGVMTSNFTAGSSSAGTTESVGLTSEGIACLILQKRVN